MTVVTVAADLLPPAIDLTDRRVELSPPFLGTDLTYQWYRETGDKKKYVEKLAGTEKTLTLTPPYTAGVYYCVATNSAGSVTSHPVRVSLTRVTTALEMVVTLKQP